MPDELYMPVFSGGLMGVHIMCKRCGCLIAPDPHPPEKMPEGTITPREGHSAFHAMIDQLWTERSNG